MENKTATKDKQNNLVKILLVVITILLFLSVFKQLLPGCWLARKAAKDLLQTDLSFIENYEEDVYGNSVSNINQQIFRVNEYEYFSLETILLQQQALLNIYANCF